MQLFQCTVPFLSCIEKISEKEDIYENSVYSYAISEHGLDVSVGGNVRFIC